MRGAVSLCVAELRSVREGFVQPELHIRSYVRVIPLVYSYCGGGMRAEYYSHAFFYAEFFYSFAHLSFYADEALRGRLYFKFFYHLV